MNPRVSGTRLFLAPRFITHHLVLGEGGVSMLIENPLPVSPFFTEESSSRGTIPSSQRERKKKKKKW
jgi:hypothetical protein